jgi:hypothetical protein
MGQTRGVILNACVRVYRAAHYIVFAAGCGALNFARSRRLQTPERCSAWSSSCCLDDISARVCKFTRVQNTAVYFHLRARLGVFVYCSRDREKENEPGSAFCGQEVVMYTLNSSSSSRDYSATKGQALLRPGGIGLGTLYAQLGILAKKALCCWYFCLRSTHIHFRKIKAALV